MINHIECPKILIHVSLHPVFFFFFAIIKLHHVFYASEQFGATLKRILLCDYLVCGIDGCCGGRELHFNWEKNSVRPC